MLAWSICLLCKAVLLRFCLITLQIIKLAVFSEVPEIQRACSRLEHDLSIQITVTIAKALFGKQKDKKGERGKSFDSNFQFWQSFLNDYFQADSVKRYQIKTPLDLIDRLPPEIREKALGYCVADLTHIPTNWPRFQQLEMPHEGDPHALRAFQPFSSNAKLHQDVIGAYYKDLKFVLDHESYHRCFKYSTFNSSFSWIRHLVIRFE